MKLIEILSETPVADYQTYSDDERAPSAGDGWSRDADDKKATIFKHPDDFAARSSSFTDKRDKTLLTNPKAVQKMKDMFANTEHDFYFYMVNSKEARNHTEVGLVDREWLEKNMKSIEPHIPDNEDGITVIFTNNKGAQKVAMSPWIMAHRIGHALNRGKEDYSQYAEAEKSIKRITDQVLKDYYSFNPDMSNSQYYSLLKKKFYEEIGTFRSARNKKLRADFEFLNETFAQWLITSSGIKLNPVPKKLITRKAWGNDSEGVWGRGDAEHANQMVQDMGEELGYIFDNMMGEATAKYM